MVGLQRGVSLLAVLMNASLAFAQPLTISSSHIAQLIYPDETLTLTITTPSPEAFADGVFILVLNATGAIVSEELVHFSEQGEIVHEVSGLDVGLWPFHVNRLTTSSIYEGPDAWTRIAVVPRPDPTITAEESPIGVDAWLAWRFPFDNESVQRASTLMQRMGIHWVRDRLAWHHVQPERDEWDWSQYDDCYRIQAGAGLQVIPVFHDVARWASPTGDYEPAHRPGNVEDLTNFTREVAEHFSGVIAGVEIANEFNSDYFWRGGSHDFAAYTKAAAAGLWQGDPDLMRLLGSSTDPLDRVPGLADIQGAIDNNVLAFIDVVTPHHYGPQHGLTMHVEWYRNHAPGHPIWVTETGSTAIPEVGPNVGAEEREQAEYLVEAYERALDAGAERVFYFCLTDFYEHGERPFGLVECRDGMWIPRLGLVELAKLAATTRLDERCASRMSDRVDREIPPVELAMFDDPEQRPIREEVGLSIEEGDIVPQPALFPTRDPSDAPWSIVETVTERVAAPGSDVAEPSGEPVREWRSDSIVGGVARMQFADFQALHVQPTGPYSGHLWSHDSQSERHVYEALSGESPQNVLDRMVVDTPVESPIALSRPSLIDVESAEPAAVMAVTNGTGATREVTVTWGDGETPRFPIAVESVTHSVPAHSAIDFAFPTVADAWSMDSRDEHMQCNTVSWVSGNACASGEAIPEWGAIAARGDHELVFDAVLEDWMGTWWWEVNDTNTVVGPPTSGWGSMCAAWDDEALWFAAIVHDDDLLNPAPIEQPWTGDSLEIYLDVNAADEIGQVGYNGRVFQLQLVPALPELPEGTVKFSNPGDWPAEGIEHAVRTTTHDGRTVMVHEIRIPWTTLGLDAAPVDREIGFDWAVNDLDTEGMSRSQLVWRGSVENWRNPSGFARIQLAEQTP